MSDIEISDIEDFPDVLNYTELAARGRAGAQAMATTIEGTGALARAQRRVELRQEGGMTERQLIAYFNELRATQAFAADEEVAVVDKFKKLQHYSLKNPFSFLLSYIAVAKGDLTKATLAAQMTIARATGHPEITQSDIIRYYRLLT